VTIGGYSSLARLASLSGVVLALAGSGTYAATTPDQYAKWGELAAQKAESAVSTTVGALEMAPTQPVCFTVSDAADIDAKLVTLERDLKVARAKARKLGGVLGCGVGVGWQIDKGSTTVDSVPFCGVVFGWRF